MSYSNEKQARSTRNQHLGWLDPVPSQAGNDKATVNEPTTLDITHPSLSTSGTDVGDAELSNRINLGDPDPKKEIHSILQRPYRSADEVLDLARANHAFHLLSVIIARQAFRRVLFLNAEITEDGPTRTQRDEKRELQRHILDLQAVITGWGSCSGMDPLEVVVSEGWQQPSLVTSGRCQDQEREIVSQNVGQVTQLQSAMAQPTVDQCIDQIKTQYDRFFPPTSSRDDEFDLLLRRDQYPRPIAFEFSQQSCGAGYWPYQG